MAEYPNRITIEIEDNGFDLEDYVLIDGFPGMGLIGTIATRYLVEKMQFKEIGHIYSNLFSPLVRIEKGLPQHPVRIFVDEKHKIVAILGEQVVNPGLIHPLAIELINWIKEKNIRRIISLNGLRVTGKETVAKVYGVCSCESERPILEKKGITIIKDGLTSGLTAQIMLFLREEKIEAVSLMAPVVMNADYKGAISILGTLSDLLDLDVNLEPLKKEAKEIEKIVSSSLKEVEKTAQDSRKYDYSSGMYS